MGDFKILFIGKWSHSDIFKERFKDLSVEIDTIRDPRDVGKWINREGYDYIIFENKMLKMLLSFLSRSITLKDFIEKRLFEFIKQYKISEGSNLYHALIREIEKPLITLVLKETGGNKKEAAHILGLNRNTLRKKIKDLNLEIKD